MRITVNLGAFFHDHRSLAKICINKKMKYIRDLEFHIAEIFNIDNFYFKCENHYLPPSEEVEVLKNDDSVWVVPVAERGRKTNINNPSLEQTSVFEKKKKKKRRYSECSNQESNVEIKDGQADLDNNTIIIKKKKKNKHKENGSFTSLDINGYSESIKNIEAVEDITKKHKTKTKSSHEEHNCTPKNADKISSINVSDSPKNNVKSLVNTFETKKDSFIGPLDKSLSNERRINIIKTIIISNKNNTTGDCKASTSNSVQDPDVLIDQNIDPINGENIEKNLLKELNMLTDPNINIVNGENNEKINDSQENGYLSNADTTISACHSLPNDLNVNKRKRKRTRKRKQSSVNTKEFCTPFEQPVYNFIHKPSIVQTPNHLRFPEGQSKQENASVTTESVDKEEVQDLKKNEVVAIDDSVISVEESALRDDEHVSAIINDIENCYISKNLMENVQPAVGNIIAFRILTMFENYTPGISTIIAGKVINYNPESGQITFEIIYGRDQCQLPQGKFSIDDDQTTEDSSKLQCLWHSLLGPRLLYP